MSRYRLSATGRLAPAGLLALFLAAPSAVFAVESLCCEPSDPDRLAQRVVQPAAQAKTSHNNVVLDFEGLEDLETVEDFYNGGTGGNGSGPGTNFGISFSSNALAIIDQDAGGTGNFGGEPSPDTILFFLTGTGAVMNVSGGFQNGFSFFYSAVNNPGQIVVYDGPDATGNVLATLNLPITPSDGGDPTGTFSPLEPVGVSFSGTAMSVDFGGTINQIGFDNITLGSATPGGAPAVDNEPSEIPFLPAFGLLLMGGLLAIVGAVRIRRRA